MTILSVLAATINLFTADPIVPVATSAYSTFWRMDFMVSEMTEIAPLGDVRRWEINGIILYADEIVWLA